MNIKIVTIGGKSNPSIATEVARYEKRLPAHINLTWRYLPHGTGDKISSIRQEAESIQKSIAPNSYIILLDETGSQLSSEKLSSKLFGLSKDLTIIIGGAYGVSADVKQQADFIWSLSELVFPHQLTRLILAEQLYRAFTIASGHPYHHS